MPPFHAKSKADFFSGPKKSWFPPLTASSRSNRPFRCRPARGGNVCARRRTLAAKQHHPRQVISVRRYNRHNLVFVILVGYWFCRLLYWPVFRLNSLDTLYTRKYPGSGEPTGTAYLQCIHQSQGREFLVPVLTKLSGAALSASKKKQVSSTSFVN